MSSVKRIWTELYRPKTIDGYVFKDQRLKDQVNNWIKEKSIPHILLSGGPGTGKTTLSEILINQLDIKNGDVLRINASDQTGVDVVREKIQNFVATIPMGDFKIVFLDEFDFLTQNAQAALRRVMEENEQTARFILSCNYIHKVIPAIKSRCQAVEFQKLDLDDFRIRLVEILANENVEFDLETLDSYIEVTYPDLRKCINTIQLNVINNILHIPSKDSSSTADWQINAVELFKKGKITEGRKLVCSQIRAEEAEDFFRLCYRNLDWWGKTPDDQDVAVVLIRDAIVKHSVIADVEINISALLIELSRISK